jgi:hypothetical protein
MTILPDGGGIFFSAIDVVFHNHKNQESKNGVEQVTNTYFQTTQQFTESEN